MPKESLWSKKLVPFVVLAGLVASFAAFVVGTPRADVDLLKQLSTATIQLLGFTGIILGIAYAVYGGSLRDFDSQSRGWWKLALHPSASTEIRENAQKQQDVLARTVISVSVGFGRCLRFIFAAAGAFAFLTIIELVHLKGVWYMQSHFKELNSFLFFAEFFLIALGIEMLVTGLSALKKAARWES